MKKIIWLMLIISLIVSCQAGLTELSSDDFREMVEAILNQETGAMTKYGSESLGRATTFEQAESQIYQVIGSFDIQSIGETKREEHRLVTKVQASPADMILTIAIDDKNRIDGVFIKTDVKAEQSESFNEEVIVLGEENIPGLITYPKDVTQPPVVILISGSGPQDRNSMIGPNVPFKDIAHGLAAKGIATIRYDDRYYHDPSLYQEKTIEEETLNDVASAITLAKTLKVNPDQIYLIGHSLGGMVIPKLLSDHSEVAGGIIMAGTPRPLWEVIRDQQLAALKQQGADQKQLDEVNRQMDGLNQVMLEMTTAKGIDILGIPDSYWLSLREAGAPTHTGFHQPILVLQGGRDFQVSLERDFAAWKTLYQDRQNVTYEQYDSLNHLFMPSLTGDINEYFTPQSVAPEVIERISDWIHTGK